jgi:WD40 repeat protein
LNPCGAKKILAVLTVSIGLTLAAHAADKITYDDQVMPIFRNACLNCHNPDKKKAGLDLSTYQATLQGSENGKVVESGNADSSVLMKCVRQTDDPKMPPKGDKLSDSELAILEKWIKGQLLENATGKAVAAASNNVAVAVVSLERPTGPPPMPGDLPLEPYVRTAHTNAITALAVSPWAPLVAIGGQKQVILYNTETLQPLGVLPFPEGFPTIIRFSRNGQLLLTGGGLGGKSGKVVLWDIKTGERVATIGNEFDQVLAADLSADQQYVALGGPTKLLKIYSTKDGKLLQSVKKHTDWITAIAFSPDGKYLASADRSGGIEVWEGATGKEFNPLPGHKAMVTGLAFMPGVVASSSEDGKVALWDVKEGKEIRNWTAHAGGAAWVEFTPDGRLVSCGRDKIAKVWDQNGKLLGQTKPMDDIALRAEVANDRVIVGDWTGKVLVTALDGKVLGELTANPPSLADRVSATAKQLTDAQNALPALQQQFTAATEKLQAEQKAAAEKHQANLIAAQAHQQDAQKALDSIKAAPPEAEKQLASLKTQTPTLEKALANARAADDAAKKNLADKQAAATAATAGTTTPELEAAKQDAAAKAAALADAEKKLNALQDEVTKANAALTKLRADQPARVATAEKILQEAGKQLADTQKPPAPAPAVTAAADALNKLKATIDANTAQLAAAKADAEHWKLATAFQSAHDAHESLVDKQAKYEQYVQAAKDAPQAVEKAKADLANAQKTVADAPGKAQEKEAAAAKTRAAADAAKQALATAEDNVKAKEKASQDVLDAAPTMGDVVTLTRKMESLSSEAAKLREERNTHPVGTPEYLDLQAKFQAKKAEVTTTQTALTAASVKNMEAPAVKAAQEEFDKARAAADEARHTLKVAMKAATEADKAVAQIKKDTDAAAQLADRLQKDMPQIIQDAETQKAQAEQAAAATAKEVEAAKAEADRRRADFETMKNGTPKAAALSTPQSKS